MRTALYSVRRVAGAALAAGIVVVPALALMTISGASAAVVAFGEGSMH